jgi:hypothetical protein
MTTEVANARSSAIVVTAIRVNVITIITLLGWLCNVVTAKRTVLTTDSPKRSCGVGRVTCFKPGVRAVVAAEATVVSWSTRWTGFPEQFAVETLCIITTGACNLGSWVARRKRPTKLRWTPFEYTTLALGYIFGTIRNHAAPA